jgi:hypothetical protein
MMHKPTNPGAGRSLLGKGPSEQPASTADAKRKPKFHQAGITLSLGKRPELTSNPAEAMVVLVSPNSCSAEAAARPVAAASYACQDCLPAFKLASVTSQWLEDESVTARGPATDS